MTAITNTDGSNTPDHSAVRTVKGLFIAAMVTIAVAVLAGISLLVIDPATGSTTEATLGLTAAVSGLITGVLAVTAVIYAQIRNLWRFVPAWIRAAVLGLVVIAFVRALIISLG